MVKYIIFEITGKCNLQCKYCYNAKYNSKKYFGEELSINKILKVLREAKKLGFELAAFSGGEPFLRNDLMQIIRNSPLPVSILTNGDLIKKEQIIELSKLKHFKELRFSLDGFEAHGRVRVNSKSDRVLSNIRCALAHGIHTSINTMITKFNIDELLELYALIKKNLSKITWRLDVPILSGRCKIFGRELFVENDVLFKRLKELIARYVREQPSFKIIISNIFNSSLVNHGFYEHSLNEHPCNYAIGSVTIRPNGDVSFCPSLNVVFGNVTKYSLGEIMHAKKYATFCSMQIKEIRACKRCKYLRVCGTGCRADAYLAGRGVRGKDTNSCSHFHYFEKYILPILPKQRKNEFNLLLNI